MNKMHLNLNTDVSAKQAGDFMLFYRHGVLQLKLPLTTTKKLFLIEPEGLPFHQAISQHDKIKPILDDWDDRMHVFWEDETYYKGDGISFCVYCGDFNGLWINAELVA